MIAAKLCLDALADDTQHFYRRVICVLDDAGIASLSGGAYALAQYTGIVRHTKDLDIFVRPADARRALSALAAAGYRTEITFAHWLGKAFSAGNLVDIIFSSGNGVAKVDDLWFTHAQPARFLDEDVLVCPAEEMIWSKAFIQERERFDGADINHLIRAVGHDLDWKRLLWRFGPHWRVLLGHLVVFGFVYPSDRDAVPLWLMRELLGRLQREMSAATSERAVCQGALLSRTQYVADIEQWGYADARLDPESGMTAEQVRAWTDAGLREQHSG